MGGVRDFDVPGQQTPLESSLHADLLPNERILRQFDVNYRYKVSLLRKIIWTVCFLCRSCLSKPVFHVRGRCVVTSQGRIGLFESDLGGMQAGNACFCIKGGLSCTNHVHIKWYHASDLSCVQYYTGQRRVMCPPWKIFCRDPYVVSLRLFFDRYPSLSQLGQFTGKDINAARTAQPCKKWKAEVPRSFFSSIVGGATTMLAHCIPGGGAFLTGGGSNADAGSAAASPVQDCMAACSSCTDCDFGGVMDNLSQLCSRFCCDFIDPADTLPHPGNASGCPYHVDIVSGRGGDFWDALHEDRAEQEGSMRALYESILQISSPKSSGSGTANRAANEIKVTSGPLMHFTGADDGKPHFNIVNQPTVLLDRSGSGVPVVNVESRHLLPGEQVVDAIPYQDHQGWLDFLGSCCNCCFFCPPSLNAAMVLTTHRIICIYINSASAAKGDGQNRKGFCFGLCDSVYEYCLESMALGSKGFQEGLLGLGQGDASLLVRTSFGGLKVRTQLRMRYPWQCAVDRNIRTRGRLFLSNFVSKKAKQVLATPPPGFNAGVSEDIQAVLPLMEGESYISTLRTEGLFLHLPDYYNPISFLCSCGTDSGLVRFVRCYTCGYKPLEHVGYVVLTTHRVLAVGFPENAPWFCKSCCTKKSLLVYWQPLTRMPGFELDATLNVDQSCISRVCSCLPCFSPAQAALSVDATGLSGFPVPVQRYLSQTNEGLLDEAQVSVIRRAMSLVTAAPGIDSSINLAALPGTAPVAAAGAGAGAGAGSTVTSVNPIGGVQ